jgi:hypothetical protein
MLFGDCLQFELEMMFALLEHTFDFISLIELKTDTFVMQSLHVKNEIFFEFRFFFL